MYNDDRQTRKHLSRNTKTRLGITNHLAESMSTHAIVILFLASMVAQNVTAQPPTKPTYFSASCEQFDSKNKSVYTENIKTILKELPERAKTSSFYNTSAGSGASRLYGQYYCRGDVDSSLCGQCIQVASQHILDSCSDSINNIALYEECTLRTDNRSVFGVDQGNDFYSYANSSTATVLDSIKFGSVLRSTMDTLISRAAYGNDSHSFATGEGVVSSSQTVYSRVQCSPDLNGTQCERCLRSSYDSIPGYKGKWLRWAWVFYTTCQLRYNSEVAFYKTLNATTSKPDPSPSLEIPHAPMVPGKEKKVSYYVLRVVIPTAIVAALILLGASVCLIKGKMMLTSSSQRQPTGKTPNRVKEARGGATDVNTTECIQFDLKTVEAATKSFSLSNKLGQGGFGIVYKGMLKDGQHIAVKRLSKNSGQGAREFKTEVAVVAKLQHRNLVRLVGCCVDREERLLVYEFVHNLSLDRFLFDATRSAYLTWEVRHMIIKGIARGLHYLHEDSRLKIVHRDLKISNILLDDNLAPKIADFGMAKLVKVDQTFDNTTKVVGTYGYMSPEYALAGRYSTKSDVYSFGVIVLEILSGKTNSRFYEISHGEGLLGYAWRVWSEAATEKLMDPILQNTYSTIEAERCLQIGLLCVQDDEGNRPPMHTVLVMLNSNTVDLSLPLSPSHSSYAVNKISSYDEIQEGRSKQRGNASKSLHTFSA